MKLVHNPMCMSTTRQGKLHVRFPDNWPGWNIPECTLSSSWDPSALGYVPKPPSTSPSPKIPPPHHTPNSLRVANSIAVKVEDDPSCDYGSDSPVFRARVVKSSLSHLHRSDSSEDSDAANSSRSTQAIDPPSDTYLALKFALREDLIDDLIQEANAYAGPLKPLQGAVVPRCYGLFLGTYDDEEGVEGGQSIGCLALEYFGENIRVQFRGLPLDSRLRLLQAVSCIHGCGLLHGDFAERNVLERDDDFRIIDFEQVQSHVCPGLSERYNESKLDEIPYPEDILCPYLQELCFEDLQIWREGY
ncbi:hypothetical protein AX16_003319 [Volvariella volvacea WC 439]|nr:hypothetical protein AX16_003319 [Volvariella volvacea WC 439]